MARIYPKAEQFVHVVQITEHERGWGSKVDETLYFEGKAEAEAYALAYNMKHNTAKEVPDWYMKASYAGMTSFLK